MKDRLILPDSRPGPKALLAACLMLLFSVYSVATAVAQGTEPTFPPGAIIADCGSGDPVGDESPTWTDIVGDPANGFWSGIIWFDATFLHFGLRINGDPTGTRGFDQKSWVALLNVPGGNPFQYQYMVSLNGNNVPTYNRDTVEIWENDPATAEDISFSPIFNDPAETDLQRIEYDDASITGPTLAGSCFDGTDLACSQLGGSTLGGDTDYLIFWAVPVDSLIAAGVIGSPVDLNNTLFFLATSADPNNYNKDDILDCPFAPPSVLDIVKLVDGGFETTIVDGAQNDITYTIDVCASQTRAVGVVIEDDTLPPCVTFDANDVDVTLPASSTLVSKDVTGNDLVVKVDELLVGDCINVEIQANAATCNQGFLNTSTSFATNAPAVDSVASVVFVLPVELTSFDAVLDGRTVTLEWNTASETNNAGFNVEHRYLDDPNADFETMGFVEGYGTTALPQQYQYRAENLAPGRHAFRLKQIDFDGTFEYSPEVEVIVEMVERFLVEPAYPNPFNPQAQFRFAVQRQQAVQVVLYDVTGRRVQVLYAGRPQAGQMHTVGIDGSGLPSGLYVVQVVGETFAETQQVMLLK